MTCVPKKNITRKASYTKPGYGAFFMEETLAQRRMFSLQVVDTDAFLEMPQSSQLLYFHLAMRADDDGFVSNPKKIMKIIGSQDDDLKVLFSKRFIIGFESGIIVIKHWKIHNYIQSDRYHETNYLEEKSTLELKDNGVYTECVQVGDSGKVSIGKSSIGKVIEEKNIIPPTFEMVSNFCKQRNNDVNVERFIHFYNSKGWMIGKNKMKDWQSAVYTWENNNKSKPEEKKESLEESLRRAGYNNK